MANNLSNLVMPNGQPIRKGEPEGAALRILSAGSGMHLGRGDLKGAEPKAWDHQLYLEMYYQHPMVFSAINKIVKTITNTGYDFVPRDSRAGANEQEVAVAKAFFDMQHNFIGELRRIYRDLLIFGDAYLYVVPDRKRRPVRLKRLAPWSIHVKAKKSGKVEFYVQKDPVNPSETAVYFQPQEILHFKMDDPGNDLYGLSPLESLKTTITTDFHMLNFQKQFFANGASMGTFIIVEDAADAELERMRMWIRDEFVGSENAYKPVIIGGKGVSIEKGVASHEEMSFLEGRNFVIEEILSVLDVPPAKVGRMESANRSNSKEQDKTFRQESVSPLQVSVESVINDLLMRGILGITGTNWEHSESDIRDAQEQMDLWKIAVQIGLLSINEVRNKMGYADVDGGDIPFVMTPTGAVPIDRLDLYFQLPRTNADDVPVLGRSPLTGDKKNPVKPNVRQGSKPATKSLAEMYADANDLYMSSNNPLLKNATHAFKRALETDDEYLREGYVSRAQGFISQLNTGVVTDG